MNTFTPVLVPGAIYQTHGMGLAEYKRVDSFYGQHTFEFFSVTYGQSFTVSPDRLSAELVEAAR